jgi:hypothetical protein
MGEGWADFVALLMFVKEEDRNRPSNANFGGTYGVTPYPLGGPDYAPDVLNNAYYYGIRRYPYSRDIDKNPLTFKHIADATPLPATPRSRRARRRRQLGGPQHGRGVGEHALGVLLEPAERHRRLTFAQAQDRMKRYLVASFKMTPTDPTFVHARDALLAVMQAQDATGRRPLPHRLREARPRRRRRRAGQPVRGQRRRRRELQQDAGGAPRSSRSSTTHAGFDHYFVTYIPDEITKLDNGTFVGWAAHRRVVQRLLQRARRKLARVPFLQHGVRREELALSIRPDAGGVRNGQGQSELAVRGRGVLAAAPERLRRVRAPASRFIGCTTTARGRAPNTATRRALASSKRARPCWARVGYRRGAAISA